MFGTRIPGLSIRGDQEGRQLLACKQFSIRISGLDTIASSRVHFYEGRVSFGVGGWDGRGIVCS